MDNKPQIQKQPQPKKNIFEKFFSLNEFRTSSLVLALYACVALGIFICLDKGDIPQNLSSLLEILVVTIGGANAVGWVSGNIANRNQYGNQFGNQYDPSSQYGMNQYQPYQSQQTYQNGFAGTNDSMINQTNPSMSDPPVGQMPIVNSQNTNTNSPV